MARPTDIDPQLLSRLAAQRASRRQFLGRGAVLAGGLALGPAFLAACGKSSDKTASGGDSTTTAVGTADLAALKGTSMTMLNWPLYIENDDAATSPTIKGFEDKYGVTVDYQSVIDSNDTFNEKYSEQLKAGKGIGADLIVLTSWNAADYVKNNWVEQLPAAYFPNKSNVVDPLANPEWDPGRQYSVPWAIGQTALAYWPDKVGGEIDDINAIFDTKYAGKVTILDEMRDTVGLTMLGMGLDPTTGSMDEMNQAVAKIGTARNAGQFKQVTGNSYTEDLTLGSTWIAMAWSGDIANLAKDNPGISWVVPKQGGMNFVDNAMIPLGAKNPDGAAAFLDYVYDPTIAGPLYESIQYVPPVKGAYDSMSADGKDSVFINPPATPKLYEFKILTAAENEELSRAFTEATQQ